MRAARQGLREPMAELLRRHQGTAAALAGRVLGSPDLARDAVQEAAIAAMTDLGRLRSPERFGAWFCGIALNVARRWRRQLLQEVPGLEPAGLGGHGEPGWPAGSDPAAAAEAADTGARVRAAIDGLSDGQRDAVRLFYLQGLSHREVAAELGVSAGAVKARLHQARAALAPRLAQFTSAQFASAQSVKKEEETVSETVDTAPGPGAAEWTQVFVSGILRSPEEDTQRRQHVMMLAERDGDRRLPIWIGPAEAIVLALALESVETPRPFPYKLAAGLVEAAGSRITEVRITRLAESVFYASVVVPGPDGPREVDARPSDAVNIAVACGAPILLNSRLLEFGKEVLERAAEGRGEEREEGCGLERRTVASMRAAAADIAAEARERMREEAERRLAHSHSYPCLPVSPRRPA